MELMVGMGIGLLATVVIIQVISVFEAQRRTTTGTADAQTNGGIALYNIARELQMAGYPLIGVTDSVLECATLAVNGVADTTPPTNVIRLSPVTITDGVVATGVSASDTITIRYGNAPMGGVPTTIRSLTGNDVYVDSNLGCRGPDPAATPPRPGDVTVITQAPGPACAMSSVTAVAGTAGGIPPPTVTLANTTLANNQGNNLACVGTWNEITYRVNGGDLERCNLASAVANGGNCNLVIPNVNFVPSVAGVVNLQAQYGVSAAGLLNNDPNFNQVAQWVDASGGTWAAPTIVNRNRIKAIRIAVVARNAKMEMAVVTAACSSTIAAAPTGLCAWAGSGASPAPAIDLGAGDPNWLRYRYRVFETIIPLRNVVWSKDTL